MHHNKVIATEYATIFSSLEPEILRALDRETHLKMLYPQMLSGHLQGRLLAMISHMVKAKNILEIGTFTAYSTICLAEGLPSGGTLHTIEVNPEFEDHIRHWIHESGLDHCVTLHLGDALQVVPQLLSTMSFDLVFLDADKANYPTYYGLLRQHLQPGAFILADNVLWGGKVYENPIPHDAETQGIVEFNQLVANDPGTEQVMLPVRDGLSLIRIVS
jgi:caffeoyl-CoA O-methyltransferase